jgi:hypothetical protein
MRPVTDKVDAMGYLLSGVGVLAMLCLAVPFMVMGHTMWAKLIPVAFLLLGGGGLWLAVRRFQAIGERVAAVVGIVIGWYMLCGMLNMLYVMVYEF